MSEARQAREGAGRRAETLAAIWLRLKGYRILKNRYRAPGGEIDLVAAWPFWGRPRLIAFVEVKQRRDETAFAEAISPQQRRRIEAGANGFLGAHPKLAQAACRFDAVFIAPRRLPRHLPNLWRRGE
jgi:putative endonuclease